MFTLACEIRKRTVSVRCGPVCVATYQSAIAIMSCTPSLVLPETPSERLRVIFIQSSAKPSAALASIVPITASVSVSNCPRIRKGTTTETMIKRPPMVGVPAFAACPAGPSSRICWPNSRLRRNSMNFGPRNMQIRSEAMPAMRIVPSIWLREDALQPDRARSLHQHAVPGRRQLLEQRARLLGGGDRVQLAVEPIAERERLLADGDQHVDPEPRGVF